MQKIPTVFRRDMDHPRRRVTDEVTPGCEWVLTGVGVATRKYDGACVGHLDLGGGLRWWARREVRPGKEPGMWFIPVHTDLVTGKTVGWTPVEESSHYKWFEQALAEDGADLPPGTYELIGPKVNGNPERLTRHHLQAHTAAEVVDAPDRSPAGLRALVVALFAQRGVEGVVFTAPDGRMAKLKARDVLP